MNVVVDFDGGTVLTVGADVVVARVEPTVTAGATTTVEPGLDTTEEFVVSGIGAVVTDVVVVVPLATRAWVPHAVTARQMPRISGPLVRPKP